MICIANQWTGLYIIKTAVMKDLMIMISDMQALLENLLTLC